MIFLSLSFQLFFMYLWGMMKLEIKIKLIGENKKASVHAALLILNQHDERYQHMQLSSY